jgi:5-methylcytosine-specific restriction endonuclease McrA
MRGRSLLRGAVGQIVLIFWWHQWRGKTIGYRGAKKDPVERALWLFRMFWHGNLAESVARAAPSENAIKIFYQSPNWVRLAREVKDERGSKCECCGATSREIRIVTDHIKPIKHHWHLRLDKKNLQVLCDGCNLQKGSWDETDFRAPDMRSRLADTFRKTARTEIDSFVRDIMFRGRKEVPGQDE